MMGERYLRAGSTILQRMYDVCVNSIRTRCIPAVWYLWYSRLYGMVCNIASRKKATDDVQKFILFQIAMRFRRATERKAGQWLSVQP
jgi:hypothetical protein